MNVQLSVFVARKFNQTEWEVLKVGVCFLTDPVEVRKAALLPVLAMKQIFKSNTPEGAQMRATYQHAFVQHKNETLYTYKAQTVPN